MMYIRSRGQKELGAWQTKNAQIVYQMTTLFNRYTISA